MRTIDLLQFSLKSAFRRRGRAILSIVAIVIGAFTFTITSGLGSGINSYIDAQTSAIGAENTVSVTATSSMALLSERLEKYDPGLVSAVAGTGAGILSQGDVNTIKSTLTSGDRLITSVQTNPQYIHAPNGEKYRFIYNGFWPGKKVNLVAGSQLDDKNSVAQIVVPAYAVKPLGFADAASAIGQTVFVGVLGVDGQVRDIETEIVGVQQRALIGGNLPFGNEAFDALLQDYSGKGAGGAKWYPYVLVVTDDVDRVVNDMRGKEFSAATAAQMVGDSRTVVTGILLVLNLLAAIAIAAAMFGIVNTLLMSIQERTRQLGLFRALGMPRRAVFTSIALEAVVLGLIGSLIAVALGVGVGMLLGPLALEVAALDLPGLALFRFDAGSLIVIVIGVTLAATAAAVIPAVRAARLSPMDALREEL